MTDLAHGFQHPPQTHKQKQKQKPDPTAMVLASHSGGAGSQEILSVTARVSGPPDRPSEKGDKLDSIPESFRL